MITAGDGDDRILRRVRRFRRAATKAHRSREVDVVDAHFALYAFVAILTTRLRRLPLVVHFQGPWADESDVSRGRDRAAPIKRAMERAVYRRADRVVVLSRAFAGLVEERYGVDARKVIVIRPGVDLERFHVGARADARERFGVPSEDFLVVVARRLDPRMGIEDLVRAWPTVRAHAASCTLLIAGDGPSAAGLAQLVREISPRGDVRLLGRISDEDLVRLYQAADCSVVPTRSLEGFGLVVLESLACGTPTLVTDAGGLPEVPRELDSSLVVPTGDVAALGARLVQAARGQLPSRAACRSFAEGFSWPTVARAHASLHAELSPESTRKPRVTFLDHCAQLSGGELALARLLPALDVEPLVILAENGPLVAELEKFGVSVEVLPMGEAGRGMERGRIGPRLPIRAAAQSVIYTIRLSQHLRRSDADLVHTNSLKAALYGGIAGRLAGVPVVWHVRDRIAPDYLPRSAVSIVRTAARVLPSAVIANSEATASTLPRLRVGQTGAVVPSAVVHDGIAAQTGRDHEEHQHLVVGIVGRLAAWKGQDLFLRAFAQAFPDGPQSAVIIGAALFSGDDERYEASLRRLVGELGLTNRVTFTGHVSDVWAELAKVDVVVHASTIPEPFGQVVVEGMAAGLAVVAVNEGGPAEVITPGVNGLLYPMGDEAALCRCMLDLDQDAALRRRLAAAGRIRAEAFSPAIAGARVQEIYKRVLRRRSRFGRRWGNP